MERVDAHQLGQLQEISHAAGVFERLVQLLVAPHHVYVLPIFFAQLANFSDGELQAFCIARHPAVVPHQLAKFAMKRTHGALALDRQQSRGEGRDVRLFAFELGVIGPHFFEFHARQVIADGVRQDEVAIGQALHERTGAQAVRAMIREVGFSGYEQSRNGAHQLVIHPQPAHRVMDGRENAHRHFVRVFTGDALIHVEQVAVAFANHVHAQPLDGIREVQKHAQAVLAHSALLVTNSFGIA